MHRGIKENVFPERPVEAGRKIGAVKFTDRKPGYRITVPAYLVREALRDLTAENRAAALPDITIEGLKIVNILNRSVIQNTREPFPGI